VNPSPKKTLPKLLDCTEENFSAAINNKKICGLIKTKFIQQQASKLFSRRERTQKGSLSTALRVNENQGIY
jgi:hypothetical protein